MIAPSGEQIEIALGDQRAVVVEVGGGLRAYSAGGRELIDGYGADAMSASGRRSPISLADCASAIAASISRRASAEFPRTSAMRAATAPKCEAAAAELRPPSTRRPNATACSA